MNASQDDARALSAFLIACPRVVALTGAGISLASGIPTYRDGAGRWRHSEPIKHQEFIGNPGRRQRYWARSMRGWPAVNNAIPNLAHRALASLERAGHVHTVITQNVDRLHQRAGSQRVIDLHGRLDRVTCLDCGALHSRELIQSALEKLNAPMGPSDPAPARPGAARPDGDVDVPDALVDATRIPHCGQCRGVLMPDVVFFGGTVPKQRVAACMQALEKADALLVIGSSLQVYSGFRFCRRAVELGKPLAIINPGSTRADGLANLKLSVDCGELLHRTAQRLGGAR